jgi:hypothetical protein
MVDPRTDPLDAEVRDALQGIHEHFATSSFESDWAAACARVEARSREQRPHRAAWVFLRRPPALTAIAALMVLGVGVAMRSPPADPVPDEPGISAAAADTEVLPVVWYTPTDELLQVSSLHYATRPAALTLYDPIDLELRP